MTNFVVESTCIFGSVARSTADAISDKDILIVADDFQRRTELASIWKEKGWSVSAYSPNRLRAVIRSGSLFAQHIKHEGIILTDREGWLKSTLKKASPKPTYLDDARNSSLLALPIERFQDDCLISDQLIVADLAFVCVRNYGINRLAEDNELTFDFTKIVEKISSLNSLGTAETELLLGLRAGKSAYRKQDQKFRTPGTVGDIKSVLGKLLPHQRLKTIPNWSPVRHLATGYTSLRDLEALVVSKLGHVPTHDELVVLGLENTWKWIGRPQEYSWQVRQFLKRETTPRISERKLSNLIHPEFGSISWP